MSRDRSWSARRVRWPVSPFSVPVHGQEPLRTIGVAYDGSPGARFALSPAIHLAILTGARVQVISIAPRNGGRRCLRQAH
jgi:hypothetical protein